MDSTRLWGNWFSYHVHAKRGHRLQVICRNNICLNKDKNIYENACSSFWKHWYLYTCQFSRRALSRNGNTVTATTVTKVTDTNDGGWRAHAHMYAHTHTHTHIHTYLHTHTYTHTHIYTHIHKHTHIHACIHTYMHTCTQMASASRLK
jgi:hypothetical protein